MLPAVSGRDYVPSPGRQWDTGCTRHRGTLVATADHDPMMLLTAGDPFEARPTATFIGSRRVADRRNNGHEALHLQVRRRGQVGHRGSHPSDCCRGAPLDVTAGRGRFGGPFLVPPRRATAPLGPPPESASALQPRPAAPTPSKRPKGLQTRPMAACEAPSDDAAGEPGAGRSDCPAPPQTGPAGTPEAARPTSRSSATSGPARPRPGPCTICPEIGPPVSGRAQSDPHRGPQIAGEGSRRAGLLVRW